MTTAIGGLEAGAHDGLPSPWIVRFASSIGGDRTVLDVACGRGRHARWLEARGFRVTGIDRDPEALALCGAGERIACDLEAGDPRDAWPLGDRRFAAVVVTNYLHRPLFPLLVAALASGGVLLYETFATGNQRFGSPRNPAFLLDDGELLARCAGLSVVAFEDGLVDHPRPASVQRICAVRSASASDRRALPDRSDASQRRSADP